MANNKRASSATTRKWTDPAIVSLLSWLNHSIQHKEIEFDETIIDYLKDSCGIQFTPSQIKSKLYNLWDKKGQNDSKSVDDLRSQGHSSLPGLALPLRSQIEAQTEFLEANTRKIQSTRQTRSSKKFWAPSVSREVSETGGQRTPRKRKYETSDISVSCPPTGEGSWPNTKNEAEEEKAKEQKGIESATDSHRQAADSILTPQPKQESHARSTSIIIDSEEESSDKQDEISSLPKFCKTPASQVITESRTATPGGRETSITPTEIKDTIEHDAELGSLKSFRNLSQDASQERTSDKAESSLKRDIHRTEQYPGELSAEPQTLNIDLRLDLAKEKIAHLQAKLSKTKQEKQEFEAKFNAKVAELGLFNSIRGQLDKSDPSYLIEKRDKKISELLTELNDRQKLVEFTKFRTSVRSRVKPYICESFMQVFAECKQVMCANDSEKLPFAPALEQSEELQFLVLRSMGLDTGFVSPEALLGLGSKLSLLGPNAVVRSLASSCLQLWVFQTEFPDFGKGSSKILETYRKLVLKQDGAIALRNLDLAARHTLVGEEYFKRELVKPEANRLAIRFSRALEPFFTATPGKSEESSYDEFATWNDDKEIWQDRQWRLVKMFKLALTAKADCSLNIEDYSFVIYPPGTLYNKATMEVETVQGQPDPMGKHEGRVVEICVEGAVFAHQRKGLQDDTLVEDALVPLNNFVTVGEGERIGRVPLVKAVVVLAS